MCDGVIVRYLVLKLVGDDGFSLSSYLKCVVGQSRTVVGVDVLLNEGTNCFRNCGLGLFAVVGFVVVSGLKRLHNIEVVLLIQIELLPAIIGGDELNKLYHEALFPPLIEVELHFLVKMAIGLELFIMLFESFDNVPSAA